jgi:hypothetical protein
MDTGKGKEEDNQFYDKNIWKVSELKAITIIFADEEFIAVGNFCSWAGACQYRMGSGNNTWCGGFDFRCFVCVVSKGIH